MENATMENNAMVRTITIHAREVKIEKLNFIACDANINNTWYKIKFTKDCETTPKKKGLYDLTINLDDCSLQRGKAYTTKNGKKGTENSTIWVRNVIKLRAYTEEELQKINREGMLAAFDGNLPF